MGPAARTKYWLMVSITKQNWGSSWIVIPNSDGNQRMLRTSVQMTGHQFKEYRFIYYLSFCALVFPSLFIVMHLDYVCTCKTMYIDVYEYVTYGSTFWRAYSLQLTTARFVLCFAWDLAGLRAATAHHCGQSCAPKSSRSHHVVMLTCQIWGMYSHSH